MSAKNYSQDDLQYLVDAFVGKLDDRFDSFRVDIDDRFDAQEKLLDKRFNNFKVDVYGSFKDLSADVDRNISVGLEKMDDRLAFAIENIDSRIEYHIKPLRQDVQGLTSRMETVEAAITKTNKDVRNLDRSIGNLEHRFDRVYQIAGDHIRLTRRVEKLEAAAEHHG